MFLDQVIFQESDTPEANRVTLWHTVLLWVVRYTEPKFAIWQACKCLHMFQCREIQNGRINRLQLCNYIINKKMKICLE